MNNICIYGSHNSALVVEIDGEIKCVLEAERFANYKNGGFAQYKVLLNSFVSLDYMLEWIKKEYGVKVFDCCYSLNTDVIHGKTTYHVEKLIPAKEYKHYNHHAAHAANCFYQSEHPTALIFSFDGGGNDGKFNVYHADRDTGIRLLKRIINPLYNHPHVCYDLGFPYMVIAHYLEDIHQEVLSDGNLVYPGKLMGLASYGTFDHNWLPFVMAFYKSNPDGMNYHHHISVLSQNIGVPLNEKERLKGEVAYKLAATFQKAFEECFLEVAKPFMDEYPDLPIGMAGGCGLNIILNTRVSTEFNKTVFVGPSPNDCGIALGGMLQEMKPKHAVNLTYSGPNLLDIDTLLMYAQTHHCRKIVDEVQNSLLETSFDNMVKDLADGHIIGVARGRAEHGPRALGNRSILCNPSLSDMKDVLNAKVKNREWYRPFAPVVRLEDVNKYFEWNSESQWMSFCPKVRDEWRDRLLAITHIDGTARVQTVTKEQNEWLYHLLTKFQQVTGVGVLLNTSFNVNGKPILSTMQDAFKIYTETQMDGLIVENYYFRKSGYTP